MHSARWLAVAGFVVIEIVLGGCSKDEPPNHVYPEVGIKKYDGILWPDYGSGLLDKGLAKLDYGALRDVKRPDGGVYKDGAPASDGPTTTCPGPQAAKCASACGAGEICTEAKGGTCVKELVLTGAATDKQVLKVVALAYVSCWNKAPAADTLCAAFNTCAMTGSLNDAGIADWVCNKAQVGDFPTSTEYDAARGLCKCSFWQGQLIYRPEWKIGSVISGKKGIVCLTFDVKSWAFDVLNVNDCQFFPPI